MYFRKINARDVPCLRSRIYGPLKQNTVTPSFVILLTASQNVTHIKIFKDPRLRIRHVKFTKKIKTVCIKLIQGKYNIQLFYLLLERQQGNIPQRHLCGTSVTYVGRNSPNTGTSNWISIFNVMRRNNGTVRSHSGLLRKIRYVIVHIFLNSCPLILQLHG